MAVITLHESETPWEASGRFLEVLTEGLAERVESTLRIELGASSELFLPDIGDVVKPVEVTSDPNGLTIVAHSPPQSEQMWLNSIRRTVSAEVSDLPLEDVKQKVINSDPLAVMPAREGG